MAKEVDIQRKNVVYKCLHCGFMTPVRKEIRKHVKHFHNVKIDKWEAYVPYEQRGDVLILSKGIRRGKIKAKRIIRGDE